MTQQNKNIENAENEKFRRGCFGIVAFAATVSAIFLTLICG